MTNYIYIVTNTKTNQVLHTSLTREEARAWRRKISDSTDFTHISRASVSNFTRTR